MDFILLLLPDRLLILLILAYRFASIDRSSSQIQKDCSSSESIQQQNVFVFFTAFG
jgi:LytS/YehU family sensor histidine kinase